ncbi:MAG: hypothetical protein ACK2UU_16005 [Anaerolineae bacterium]|jgi:hypothetical protein
MKLVGAVPLLISVLVGLLLGLVSVGFLGLVRRPAEGNWATTGDGLLLGLLALAAFAMGVFLTYLVFGLLV